VLVEANQQGSNGCIPDGGVQTSVVEFTVSPAIETRRDEESEDDDDDDDDDDDEDVVVETGQPSDGDDVVQACTEDVVVTEAELPTQNVSRFDARQKRGSFIDVWWLFDDGGTRLNVIMQSLLKDLSLN